ncbi:hypothetical protein CXB51_000481 [Gossypium anomalum]|uniref:Reverse transcriptase Ty1/copia-type domain-containing protein n=1 Tax=Gossypium anomalum TaxID=47600 RepID=A0A8J6DEN9_9ROSI|nr:hypothetical protein CXB51_000481 [Gossypium anomalum]
MYVLVYVDDIIIIGSAPGNIDVFVQQLHNEFSPKDMGDLYYFLGNEVTRLSTGSLHLCQHKYILDLLDRSSLANANGVYTLMISSSILSKDEPDIAYAVNQICQFMHVPTSVHLIALKRILRYLSGIVDYGLVFLPSDKLSLIGYADANWGLDFDDRRSTTGYCVYFGNIPISWCSKKQQVLSHSRAEAEYRSLAAATSDVICLVSLLKELQFSSNNTPAVWCDNSSDVVVVANFVLHLSLSMLSLTCFSFKKKWLMDLSLSVRFRPVIKLPTSSQSLFLHPHLLIFVVFFKSYLSGRGVNVRVYL